MDVLKQKFYEKASRHAESIKALLKEHSEKVIEKVTVGQIYGGMRDIISMVWETSLLDPIEGIRFRGYSIDELKSLLPKGQGNEPLPEGLFWLMLVGEIPTEAEVRWLSDEWERRRNVPPHVLRVLESLPKDTHPMTQFSLAIASMQTESVFGRRYAQGMGRQDYWDATYEDTMNLIASLPKLAALIYRRTYHNSDFIEPDDSLDWAASFAHMLGYDNDDFKNLMRLYLTIHADHEGGNASAHSTHLVGSTLSDAYLSFASGMNALAGPLHGLANQEVIRWIFNMTEKLGVSNPTEEQIAQYVRDTLKAGKVVPGYGHAVLRRPDPRFLAQKEFAAKYITEKSDVIEVVWKVYDIVPPILQSLGKVKNPWPNVDAHSGALLVHYGMREYDFYTVLFGVSRSLGVLAQLCWSRALGFPLERPKSVTTSWVNEFLAKEAAVNVG